MEPNGWDVSGDDRLGSEDEETDADYRARMMHVDTFLRLNESINNLEKIGKENPQYALDIQKILHTSLRTEEAVKSPDGKQSVAESSFASRLLEEGGDSASSGQEVEMVRVKTHAHLIYHGDLLQLSKETVYLKISKRDMALFSRIISCFKRMIMGVHTDKDVANMRRDHDLLIAMWDDVPANVVSIGVEIKNMMRSMLETPLYYTSSCMALIACGKMLRNLYVDNEGSEPETYEQLMCFVRKHMRHNPADPFECNCGEGGRDDGVPCSEECKTLMSMIMEVPPIVHNQVYLLQILAYLMYDKSGREGVFINNLKNTCSPGLLDKIPTRLAMLIGTLDDTRIKARYKIIRKQLQHMNPLKDRTNNYNKNSLQKLVQWVHHPRLQTVLADVLPGAGAATVELRLPKCGADKKQCLNKEFDEKSIMSPESNNDGKNKCCGYLRQDPCDMLVSSISLAQLLVYVFTDSRTGPARSRQHFYVRDIITSMAAQTVKIKLDTLEEMFCHLDRTRVFKSFNEHPFMMRTLQELFTSYIDYMKDAAEKYKETGKGRRVKRYLRKLANGGS